MYSGCTLLGSQDIQPAICYYLTPVKSLIIPGQYMYDVFFMIYSAFSVEGKIAWSATVTPWLGISRWPHTHWQSPDAADD